MNSTPLGFRERLTRRNLLRSAAVAAVPFSVAAVASDCLALEGETQGSLAEAVPEITFSHPAERVQFHAEQLAAAMAEMHPDRKWRAEVDHAYHFAMIIGDSKA